MVSNITKSWNWNFEWTISRFSFCKCNVLGATPNTDLLPEIRKIVDAAIKSALRDADISISQENQDNLDKLANEKTQAFLIDMADNF